MEANTPTIFNAHAPTVRAEDSYVQIEDDTRSHLRPDQRIFLFLLRQLLQYGRVAGMFLPVL